MIIRKEPYLIISLNIYSIVEGVISIQWDSMMEDGKWNSMMVDGNINTKNDALIKANCNDKSAFHYYSRLDGIIYDLYDRAQNFHHGRFFVFCAI
jgi:hypothetical protein